MPSSKPRLSLSRRKFIGACCASVGAAGMASALGQLRALGAVTSAATGRLMPSDYRALVCVFLAGGNDSNNVIVPLDPSAFAAYTRAREAVALPRSAVLPLQLKGGDGRRWGFHPALAAGTAGAHEGGLKALFERGEAAVVANVGPLAFPLTQAEYRSHPERHPGGLFSHAEQQVAWQSGIADQPFTTGWGGRIAELTSTFNGGRRTPTVISLTGRNSFQVGRAVSPFELDPFLLGAARDRARDPLAALQAKPFLASSDASHDDLMELAACFSTPTPFASHFAGMTSPLSQHLHTIARVIAAQGKLGVKRQVFYVRVNGWDLHEGQVNNGDRTAGAHAALLSDLSRSVAAFQSAVHALGAADQVTTFTTSDFGRALVTDTDGADHGWGSHHFVVGGAVTGGTIYGRMPEMAVGSPDDAGKGRWIPTTSVDQYAATLARWFGVSDADLPYAFPNLNRFATHDLGFLA